MGEIGDQKKIIKIQNLPNEPPFQLKIEKEEIRFKYVIPNPAFAQIQIINELKKRFCVKVKSTDNKLFDIQPAIMFIEPGQSIYVKITLKDTTNQLPENHHYIGIFHVETSAKSVTEAFKQGKIDGVLRLPMIFEREGGAEDPPQPANVMNAD
ncbi:unnamed protein product [Caenorhabditis angaria]|uniref:Major sperm protein n=1 Tax=Caenorhabditis angaria TaxID=860376 RepID=A0A9P1MWS2_9PELO|nr:unnamed protein product [Caenorhabditis angaria]